MTRRSFLKALLAPPIAAAIGLKPPLASSAKVTAQGVTLPLATGMILFAGNLMVSAPRMTYVLKGIAE